MAFVENRESFFSRLEPFFTPSTLLNIELAYTLSKFGHRSQFRKEVDDSGNKVRYFEHVRRAAIILVDEVKIVTRETVISCLLHDCIEDTKNINAAMIEHCFGQEVTSLVKTLSKVPEEGYLERFYMNTDWRAYLCKACDRLDNLRHLDQTTKEFRAKQIAETKEKYYPLFDRMLQLTPPEYLARVSSIRDLIRSTTDYQEAAAKYQTDLVQPIPFNI